MTDKYMTTSEARFPYCQKHNRLYVHWSIGWFTPAKPQDLHTFQALCDACKKEAICNLIRSYPAKLPAL